MTLRPNGTEYRITRSRASALGWVAVLPDGTNIAGLTLDPKDHEITLVWTARAHRRQGIARALFEHAKRQGFDPQHSPHRTRAGDAWAHAVGGEVPPHETAEDVAHLFA